MQIYRTMLVTGHRSPPIHSSPKHGVAFIVFNSSLIILTLTSLLQEHVALVTLTWERGNRRSPLHTRTILYSAVWFSVHHRSWPRAATIGLISFSYGELCMTLGRWAMSTLMKVHEQVAFDSFDKIFAYVSSDNTLVDKIRYPRLINMILYLWHDNTLVCRQLLEEDNPTRTLLRDSLKAGVNVKYSCIRAHFLLLFCESLRSTLVDSSLHVDKISHLTRKPRPASSWGMWSIGTLIWIIAITYPPNQQCYHSARWST
jgi:hypothetical protein